MKTIRARRQAQGWTQFELALRVGVQPQAVYLWESGRRTPQVPQLRRLGAVFGLCSDDIDLEPSGAEANHASASHQPRADRPGRDPAGRPVPRRQDGDPAP